MISILGIGVDYLMLKRDSVRGDVCERQFEYAKELKSLTMVTFSPKNLGFKNEKWGNNIFIYPTNSYNRTFFIFDALKISSKICQHEKIDVITTEDPFTCGLVGLLLKKIYKIPLNLQVHIDFIDEPYWIGLRLLNRIMHPIGKFVCKRADSIRVDGRETKEKLIKHGISPNKITVLSVHSDITRFQFRDGAEIRNIFVQKGFDQILLFVGRLTDQKDLPNLFAAFKLVIAKKPKALLLLVGKGPKEHYLRRKAHANGIANNVIFSGVVEHSKIPEYYAASDIFVLPSIVEGRATVLVEAMLSKKPVVTTDVSGVYDWIIDKESGFIVKRRDPGILAQRILFLLDNPLTAKSFGERAYQIAQAKTQEIVNMHAVVNLWEKTAAEQIRI